MKKIQTNNSKRAAIGTGKRTVGLTSKPRTAKPRTAKTRTTAKRSIISTSRSATKKTTNRTGGCSGCSRNKK